MSKPKDTPKPKQKETKESELKSYEYKNKIDLKSGLNDISFNNKQVDMIRNLQSENVKLKQLAGRNRRQSSMPKIAGLRGLEGNLGMQGRKKE